jgi:hypothetical protein
MAREPDPGYGPPPGDPSGPARGGGVPFDVLARAKREVAGLEFGTSDPAFLRTLDATDGSTRARAALVYKDVPLVTIQNTWSIDQMRGAIYAHIMGQFYSSGMLCESILGDDRVTATLNARASALFGREARFKPANDSAAAREVCDVWRDWWPRFSGTAGVRQLHDYGTMMGFSHGQLCWDTHQRGLGYAPTLHPWHPVFEYWDWDKRCYMAIGSEGVVPIIPGNGKWLEFSPWGYRGWMRGALRPVTEPWALRHFGFRDMARFGEVHGNPTRVGRVPIVGDPVERMAFQSALASLGADAALIVPGGVDPKDGQGYGYELVEATSQAWQVHPAQIDRCDMAIVLAILMVNLTTEVKGGSYAAASVAQDKELGGTQFDNQNWKSTLYSQVARPFAFLNFGDADLAPWTWYDIAANKELEDRSKRFYSFGQGVEVLRRGGVEFTDASEVHAWAVDHLGLTGLPKFKIVEPVKSTPAKADEGGSGGGDAGTPGMPPAPKMPEAP